MNKEKALLLILWVLSIGFICYGSLIPQIEMPMEFWNADKVYHFLAYGWLALLPMLALIPRRMAISAALSMILLGVLLEIGQRYVPGREFSLWDMAANTLGVLTGIAAGIKLRSTKKIMPPS